MSFAGSLEINIVDVVFLKSWVLDKERPKSLEIYYYDWNVTDFRKTVETGVDLRLWRRCWSQN